MPPSEVELCAIVRDWLLLDGWDVHQEVSSVRGTIDMLAVGGKLLWAIEAKTRLSFGVCAQALERKAAVHQVSIAVPKRRALHNRCFNSGNLDDGSREHPDLRRTVHGV